VALTFRTQERRRDHARVGLADGRAMTYDVDPNDVSYRHETGVRYFYDGALVGILRSLRSRRVRGNLVLVPGQPADPDIFLVEPDWDGARVPMAESAAKFALDLSMAGFFVIAPTLLGFDTPKPQYLWRSVDERPATDDDEFAVLLPKGAGAMAMAMAFSKESGGG